MKFNEETATQAIRALIKRVKELFDLRMNLDLENAEGLIRANVDFKSVNAWTLVFAIFIASVGLNVNSPAVIIGAMLISPLMGPIVGLGFALGIRDNDLLRRCLRNIGYALAISIFTSTLYFLVSPLAEAQSEIIARTRPSFFDVLVAFFGGAAGIVAISQKEKGNIIPGVAIATALMPPLCAAGYSLANGQMSFFLGAIYLFSINALFIAISTYLFVRYLRFPVRTYSDVAARRIGKAVSYAAAATVIPSLVTAWYLQRESTFAANVNRYAQHEIKGRGYLIANQQIEFTYNRSTARFDLVGDVISKPEVDALKEKAGKYGIENSQIEIKAVSFSKNMEKAMAGKVSAENVLAQKLSFELSKANAELEEFKNAKALAVQLSEEVKLINKSVLRVELPQDEMQAQIIWRHKPKIADRTKVERFVELRTQNSYQCCNHLIYVKSGTKTD